MGVKGKGPSRVSAERKSLGFPLAGPAPFLAQRSTFQFDAIGVMDQAIQDAVG